VSEENRSSDFVICPIPECGMIFSRNELVPGFGGVLFVTPEHQDSSRGILCRGSFKEPNEMVDVNLPSRRKLRKKL